MESTRELSRAGFLQMIATLGTGMAAALILAVTFVFSQWSLTVFRVIKEPAAQPLILLGLAIATFMFLAMWSVLWLGIGHLGVDPAGPLRRWISRVGSGKWPVGISVLAMILGFVLIISTAVWMAFVSTGQLPAGG